MQLAGGVPSLRELGATLLHFLFPSPCRGCGGILDAGRRSLFCSGCWAQMAPVAPPICPKCGWPFPSPRALEASPTHLCARCRTKRIHFAVARAATLYREAGRAREAILAFKYTGRETLGRYLAELMAERSGPILDAGPWDVLVPVPLHPRRERERGNREGESFADRRGRLRVRRGQCHRVAGPDSSERVGVRTDERMA